MGVSGTLREKRAKIMKESGIADGRNVTVKIPKGYKCRRCKAKYTMLLKKHLPMKVTNRNKFYPFYADCPKCGWHISMGEHKNFCGYCGQRLRWR